jgi:hypothetical protein
MTNLWPAGIEFYLIMDLAAGGTSGWFPDNVGNKPWYDGSASEYIYRELPYHPFLM